MTSITIVGLGPGHPDQLTLQAYKRLNTAANVYVRTERHPTLSAFDQRDSWTYFDSYYETHEDFADVYGAIVATLIAKAEQGEDVVYAVPGHPHVAEDTVTLLIRAAREHGIAVDVIAGISFIEPSLSALNVDALPGLVIFDALDIVNLYHPPFDVHLPVMIPQLYSRLVASDVKMTLMNQYPEEHMVTMLYAAGTEQEVVEHVRLFEIDHSETIDHLTTLFVPAVVEVDGFADFANTVAHLRSPEGCPWDQKQTHASLRKDLLAETYEVVDAIDREDVDGLREELGDLLLHILMQTQIATEDYEFTLTDVVTSINQKMIRRHPHVFSTEAIESAEEVAQNWQQLKAAEKAEQGEPEGLLESIPLSSPALVQAYDIQSRAAKVGFDWDDIQPVVEKITEELEEIKTAKTEAAQSDEIGDLLFAIVNWARWMKLDPEAALRGTNRRFKSRFGMIEDVLMAQEVKMDDVYLEDLDLLWDVAKVNLRD